MANRAIQIETGRRSAHLQKRRCVVGDTHLEKLARRLHDKAEHLDPTDDDLWDAMSEDRRDFYRLCIEWLLLEPELILAALGERFPNDNLVRRRVEK